MHCKGSIQLSREQINRFVPVSAANDPRVFPAIKNFNSGNFKIQNKSSEEQQAMIYYLSNEVF